jgi:hypothetical protein
MDLGGRTDIECQIEAIQTYGLCVAELSARCCGDLSLLELRLIDYLTTSIIPGFARAQLPSLRRGLTYHKQQPGGKEQRSAVAPQRRLHE